MKPILFTFYFLLFTFYSFSQYFVPFGADSLWNDVNDSTYAGSVFTLKVIDGNLYMGSENSARYGGNVLLYGSGYWDTENWHSLNNGAYPENARIYDIVKYKNCLYFANAFGWGAGNVNNSGYLSAWNGTQWLSNPAQINGEVYCATVNNDTLFFGGGFHSIGTEALSYLNVGAFDGTNFIKVGSLPSDCRAMVTYNGVVYAGGINYLKKYVGGQGYEAWQNVAYTGDINELKVDTFNNFLNIACPSVINGMNTNGIVTYDGFTFTTLDTSGNNWLGSVVFEEYRGELYAMSSYDNSLIKWDDTNKTWVTIEELKFPLLDLEVYDDMLYIGGVAWSPYWGCMDSLDYGIARYFVPEDSISACAYLKPRVQSYVDTFYISGGVANAQLYNNNRYANTWQWNFGDGGTDSVQNPTHIFTQTGTYTVSVTVSHNTCTKTATKDIVVALSAGIKETPQQESGFKLYPNPTKSLLFVEIKDEKLKIKNEAVQIIDINGKTVKQSVIANAVKQSVSNNEINFVEGFAVATASPRNVQTIDISRLKKGVYFVKIGEEVQRFVKR